MRPTPPGSRHLADAAPATSHPGITGPTGGPVTAHSSADSPGPAVGLAGGLPGTDPADGETASRPPRRHRGRGRRPRQRQRAHGRSCPVSSPHTAGRGLGGPAVVVLVVLAATALLVCAPGVAYADTGPVLALAASVDEVLTNLRNWIMGILAGVATVFFSIGGMRHLVAGGDPGEMEKAKAAYRSAAIGYGLAALAPLVVAVLRGIVGA